MNRWHVATEAIVALGKIGPAAKSAVPVLCAVFVKEGEKNAHAIVFALGNIGPDAAAAESILLQAMDSNDKSLAVIAARSFIEIQPPSSRSQAASRAVSVLASCLSDPLPETRKAAAESLAALGPLAREATPALEKASKDSVTGVREAAAKALSAIQSTPPAVERVE
jgi:HEAT repeat protein